MNIRIILTIILMMFNTVSADIFVGGGFNIKIPGHDNNETHNQNLVIHLEGEDEYPLFVAFNYIDEYEVYGQTIDNHYIAAVGKRIVDFEYLFFDFGIAVTSQKSIVNSSLYMFYERIGFRYGDIRATVGHWSNAGLKPPNEGETIITLEYRIEF